MSGYARHTPVPSIRLPDFLARQARRMLSGHFFYSRCGVLKPESPSIHARARAMVHAEPDTDVVATFTLNQEPSALEPFYERVSRFYMLSRGKSVLTLGWFQMPTPDQRQDQKMSCPSNLVR